MTGADLVGYRAVLRQRHGPLTSAGSTKEELGLQSMFGAASVDRVAFNAAIGSSQTHEGIPVLKRLCSRDLAAQFLEPGVLAASPRADVGEIDVDWHCLIVSDASRGYGDR